jgi:hypothetical protein
MQKLYHCSLIMWILFSANFALNSAQAQISDSESIKNTAPKLYIECNYCDMEYIRTEITFVNYVRDRKDAQIHLLITTQSTGSGGTEYTLTFSGQEQFSGNDNVFRYVANKNDTADEIRGGLVRMLKIGLVPYAARTPIADRIFVSYQDKEKPASVKDKWNYWVLSVSGNGYLRGETTSRSYSVDGSFSANRITPAFKFRMSYTGSRSTDRFFLDEGALVSISKSHNFNMLAVKSINNHWSIGSGLTAYTNTYNNVKFAIKPAPAIEYDFYPYSESTRRQLRILWKPGYNSYRYREDTIYDKTAEDLWGETFSATLDLKEKWGTISNSIEAFHYFQDLHKNHVQINSNLSLRLYRGLSLNLFGSYSRIHDQLSLPKGGASLEEVLLRTTQLATSYSFNSLIGLSYTFGSMFSNVVNPRFDGY